MFTGQESFPDRLLDPENRPARQLLEDALRDSNALTRCVGAKWLYAMTGETATTIPVIAECLNHVVNGEDQTIIRTAGDFGRHAKTLVPKLERFLTHPDHIIRLLVGKARRAISAAE